MALADHVKILPNILSARHPYAVAASLKSLNQGKAATDFQAVLISPDIGVFSNEFECPIGRRCVENEQKVALFVLHLLARLWMKRGLNFLGDALMQLNKLPQHPFGINGYGLGSLSLSLRDSSGDDRF